MAIQTNRLTNANVYADGANLIGRAEEVDAPKLTATMAEHKALGLQGKMEFPAGFDKMEMRIKWNAIYPDVAKKFANVYKAINIQVRASLETWVGGDKTAEVPVVIYATVQAKGIPMGNFKAQDNVEMETNLACTYAKMEIDGQSVVEFDAQANIYIVDGVDLLKDYRANLGL